MVAGRSGCASTSARLGQGDVHQLPPRPVGDLQTLRERVGLGRILGEQQPRRLHRLPDPPRRVQARGDRERDRLEVDGLRRHPSPREQCGDPGPRPRAEPLETEARDRAVLADDGRHVRDRADGREIGQVEGRGAPAGQIVEQQLGELERDPAPGQPTVGVARIGSVRVHDRERGRQRRRDPMVVGHEHVDATGRGDRDLRG